MHIFLNESNKDVGKYKCRVKTAVQSGTACGLCLLFLYQSQDSRVQRGAIHEFYNTHRSLKALEVEKRV